MAVSDRQVRVILKRIAEAYGVSEPTNLTISQQREWIEELAPGFLSEASDLRPAQQRELIETFLPTSATGDVVHAAESVTDSVGRTGARRLEGLSRERRDTLFRRLAEEHGLDPSDTGLSAAQRDEWLLEFLPENAGPDEIDDLLARQGRRRARAAVTESVTDLVPGRGFRGALAGDQARYLQFRRIAEEHGLEMSFLSQDYEARQVAAYRQASEDVNDRIARLRGRIEELSSHGEVAERERWRLARETGLLQDIEGRIEELGGQTRTNIVEGWTEAGAMARSHIELETIPLVDHINATSGTGGNLAQAVDFSKLDTTAIELGVGTAVADNARLTLDMQYRLRQEIQAGLAAGLNVQRISGRVNDVMEIGAERSEMITRWAMIKGNNLSRQASFEVMQQTVPQVKKQWLAQPDELTCPHCLAQHGTVIEVQESFDPENTYAATPIEPYDGFTLTPPLHPRCRCLIIAWNEEWRPYTEFPPEYVHEAARERAISQGYWRALEAGQTQSLSRVSMSRRLARTERSMRLRLPTPTGIVKGTFRLASNVAVGYQAARMTYRGVRFVARSRQAWLAWAVELARFEQFAADLLRGAGFNPVRGLIEEGLVVLDPRGQGGEFLTRLAPDEIRDWIGRLNEQALFLDEDEIPWRVVYDLRFLEVWELPRWVTERFRGEQAFRLRQDEVFAKLVTDDYVQNIEDQVAIVGEGGLPFVRVHVVGEELPTLEPTPLTVQERVAAAQQELVQEVEDELEAAAGALREADAIVAREEAVTVIPFPGRDDVGDEVSDLTESGEVIRLIVGLRKFIARDWTNFAGLGIRARGPWTFSVDSFGRWVSYFRPRSYLRRSPTFFESTVSAAEEGIDEASDYISDEVWNLARTFFERMTSGEVTAEEVRLFISWQMDSNRQRARSSYRRMRGYVENLRNRLDVDWTVPNLELVSTQNEAVGGMTAKLFFRDQDGQRWLFKTNPYRGMDQAEELANRTAHALGLEVVPGSAYTAVNQAESLDGYVQRWVEDATSYRTELVRRTPWYRRLRRIFDSMTDEEVEQFQEYMVLDWLVGNQDVHWEQFIVRDGRLIHIDFGYAFEPQTTGLREVTKVTFAEHVEAVSTLRAFREQVGDRMSVESVTQVLARIEEMDQDEWVRRVRSLYETIYEGADESLVDDAVNHYRQRLLLARSEVTEFYGDLLDDAERVRIQGLVGDEEGWYGRYLDRDLDWQRTQTGLPGEGQLRILRELTEGPESAQFPIWRDLPTVQARQTVREARPHPDIVEGAVWDGYERFQRQIEFRVIADPENVEEFGEVQAGAIWVLKEHLDAGDAQAEQMAGEFFNAIGVPSQGVLATTRDEFENIAMLGFDADGNWGALPFIWVDGPEGRRLTQFVWGDLEHMTLSQKELPPWYSFEDVWASLVLDRDDLSELGETLFLGFAGDVAAGADAELQIVVRSLFQNMVGDWLLMNTDLSTAKFRVDSTVRSVDRFRILWNNLAEGDGNISFKDYAEGLWGADSNMAGARFYRELVEAYRAGRVRFDPDDLAPLVAQAERFDPSYYRRWLEDRWRLVNPEAEDISDEVASRIDSALGRLENLRENLEEAFRAWGSEADPVWGGMWTPRWARIRQVPNEALRLRSTSNYAERSVTARRMGLNPSDRRLTIYDGLVEGEEAVLDDLVRLRREEDRLQDILDDIEDQGFAEVDLPAGGVQRLEGDEIVESTRAELIGVRDQILEARRRLEEVQLGSTGAGTRWVTYEQGHADAYAEQIAREFLAAAGVDVFPSHVVRREVVEYTAADFVEVGDTLPRISEPDDFRPVLFLFEDYPAGYQILNDMADEGAARSVVHLGQELEDYGYEMFDQFLETMIWHWLLDVRSTPLGLHEIRRGGVLAAPVLTHPFASRARLMGPRGLFFRTSFEDWLTEPANEFASSVWRELIDAYRAGDIDFNFDRVDGILSRIERMDRTEWKGKIRRFLELRARNLGRTELSEAELAYEGVLMQRARNIREDVTSAFRSLAEERGDDWIPIWDDLGVPGVPTNRMLPSARLRSVAPERWDEIRRAAENC